MHTRSLVAHALSELAAQLWILTPLVAVVVAFAGGTWDVGLVDAAEPLPGLLFGLWLAASGARAGRLALLARIGIGLLVAGGLGAGLRVEILIVGMVLHGAALLVWERRDPALVPGGRAADAVDALVWLAGPLLSMWLLTRLGIAATLALASLLLVLPALWWDPDRPSAVPRPTSRGGAWAVLWSRPHLRVLALANGLHNGLFHLRLVVYVVWVLDGLAVAPLVLGAVFSLGNLGLVGGALLQPLLSRRLRAGSLLWAAATFNGLSAALLPLVLVRPGWALWLLVLSELLRAAAFVVYDGAQQEIREASAPGEERERVAATLRQVSYVAAAPGALAGGLLGAWISPAQSLPWIAAATFLPALVVGASALRRADPREEVGPALSA